MCVHSWSHSCQCDRAYADTGILEEIKRGDRPDYLVVFIIGHERCRRRETAMGTDAMAAMLAARDDPASCHQSAKRDQLRAVH